MQATKETVQKRPHTALWIILCVVLLCAAGAALYFCRWAEKPLTLAEGYVAAEGLTANITDGEGAVLSQPVRGTKVTYVVEDEDKDHPGLVRLVLGEDSFGYLAREQLVTDPKDVVATKIIYVRTAVNLLDEAGAVPGRLVQKGEALTVTGWQDMDASGAVGRWQVEGGYIRAEYVTMDEPSAKAQYDQEVYQLHAERGDSWGGGDAAGLDYFPREKARWFSRMPASASSVTSSSCRTAVICSAVLMTSVSSPRSSTSRLVPRPSRNGFTPHDSASPMRITSCSRLVGKAIRRAGPPIRKEVCLLRGTSRSMVISGRYSRTFSSSCSYQHIGQPPISVIFVFPAGRRR